MEDAAGGRRTGPDAPRPDDPDAEDPFGRSKKPATPGKGERDAGRKPGA